MRLILDTNQAKEIHTFTPPRDCRPILVVPPMTWAEILLAPRDCALSRIRAIAEYDVRFGMEDGTIYEHLRQLCEDDIARFDPVFPVDSVDHQRRTLDFSSPNEQCWEYAQKLRAQTQEFAASVTALIAHVRKERQVAKIEGETITLMTWSKFADAERYLIGGPDAPYRKTTVELVTKGGTLPLRAASNDSFFDAFLRNPPLQRFLKLRAAVVFGYLDTWDDRQLNIGFSENRNDVPDTMLPLYARNGDTILTKDKKLRRAFTRIESRTGRQTIDLARMDQGSCDGGRTDADLTPFSGPKFLLPFHQTIILVVEGNVDYSSSRRFLIGPSAPISFSFRLVTV